MAASSEENTILKVRVFGVDNTSTNWFFHQAKANQSLESIIEDIFSGSSSCVGDDGKIKELTGLDGAKFGTPAHAITNAFDVK